MLGKKKKEKTQEGQVASQDTKKKTLQTKHHVEIIPHEFYGGKDPVIYPKHPQVSFDTDTQEDIHDVSSQPTDEEASKVVIDDVAVSQQKKRRKFIVIGVVVFIFIIVSASVVIVREELQQATTPVVLDVVEEPSSDPVTDPVVVPPAVTDPPTSTAIGIDEDPEVPPSLEEAPLFFPTGSFVRAVDTDDDDLTDDEEQVFGTDPGIVDVDGDGYRDGLEIENLYSPSHVAPFRLVDSGLVREYIHPVLQYRVYYPTAWDIAGVDVERTQVLISAPSSDFIEIRSFTKQSQETFTDWFSRVAPDETYTNLRREQNRFDVDMFVRTDRLVGYIVEGNRVFVMVYRPQTGTRTLRYPFVMEMVMQSFRPTRVFEALPEQVVIPEAPAFDNPPGGFIVEDGISDEFVSSTTDGISSP